jgi:hypothetical protein
MKLTVVMPEVRACAVSECAYNAEGDCHAKAITIGDGAHPACDTFCPSDGHVTSGSTRAGVGACKVAACVHNQDLECTAATIQIDHHRGHADCMTFEPR